jgi:iron complex transport system substrate-binding protein
MRVASLLPSTTEIVCALGLEKALVGRSHECDHPPSVAALPVLTAPKIPLDGTSAEIDAAVKRLVAEALSVYRVDTELLAALRPDVILTQAQCEVCAVSERDVEAALAEMGGARPRVVSLSPRRLADVWADLVRVGQALGRPTEAAALAAQLEARVEAVAARANDQSGHSRGQSPLGRDSARVPLASPIATRPTVACLEWVDPPMGAGSWIPELVALAGGEPVFGAPGEEAAWIDWAELCARDPEVIVLMPCGFGLARACGELSHLRARHGWSSLRAVRAGRLRRRRQPELQPPRATPRRVAGDPGGDPPPGGAPLRLGRRSVQARGRLK